VNPRVFVLTLVTFAFGSAAFIFAGLLETMAADLGVSTAVAGQLQTAYVLTSAALGPVAAWALGRLDRPLSVRDLARQAGMSDRTFARRFVAETGRPPLQWLLQARVDLARDLLESGTLGIDQIATRTGLGTAINLRVHFRRLVGTTPSAYRRTFQSGPPLPPASATIDAKS